jgi:hypothetical protein
MRVSIELIIWPKVGINGGLFWAPCWTYWLHKRPTVIWLAATSMKFVHYLQLPDQHASKLHSISGSRLTWTLFFSKREYTCQNYQNFTSCTDILPLNWYISLSSWKITDSCNVESIIQTA